MRAILRKQRLRKVPQALRLGRDLSASLNRRSENVCVLQVIITELELGKMKLRKPRYRIQSLESGGRHEKLEILGLDSLRVFGGGCYWHGCRGNSEREPGNV